MCKDVPFRAIAQPTKVETCGAGSAVARRRGDLRSYSSCAGFGGRPLRPRDPIVFGLLSPAPPPPQFIEPLLEEHHRHGGCDAADAAMNHGATQPSAAATSTPDASTPQLAANRVPSLSDKVVRRRQCLQRGRRPVQQTTSAQANVCLGVVDRDIALPLISLAPRPRATGAAGRRPCRLVSSAHWPPPAGAATMTFRGFRGPGGGHAIRAPRSTSTATNPREPASSGATAATGRVVGSSKSETAIPLLVIPWMRQFRDLSAGQVCFGHLEASSLALARSPTLRPFSCDGKGLAGCSVATARRQ